MTILNSFLLEALQPDPSKTSFPFPSRVGSSGFLSGTLTYESFNLGGVPMPGQWLLVDCTREFGWQIRKGIGLTGATVVPIGDDPLAVKFAIKIWTSADAAIYRSLLKTTLRKPVGLIPGALSSAGMGIDQPQLLDMGVNAVVVKSVTPLMNPLVTSGGKGPWTAEVGFYEYRKPLPALPTPNTFIPDVGAPVPSALDNLDTENALLAKQFAAKAAALSQSLSGGPVP